MKLIQFLMAYSSRLLALAVIAGIISGACNTGLLAVINSTLKQGHSSSFLFLLWAFIGLCVVVPLARIASELVLIHLGQGALLKLRTDLSRQMLSVPLRRLEEIGPHKLMAALTDDVPVITNMVMVIPLLCINVAIALSCLIYMGTLSWSMLLSVLGIILLGIFSYQWAVARSYTYMQKAREHADALYNHFRALTDGIKELKLHQRRRKAFVEEALQSTGSNLKEQNIAGMKIYTVASSWGQLLVFVVIGLLLFGLSGLSGFDEAKLTGFTLSILYLMTPLQVIMNTLPTLGRATVALKKVEDLGLTLKASSTEDESKLFGAAAGNFEKIELEGVIHNYKREGEESNFMLGPIDLTLKQGEIVFLTGGNGSGKTTLSKLIVGLYTPEGGQIKLDDRQISDELRDFYREHFSVVFSDFYLFNSILGMEKAEVDEKAKQYLKRLELSHKVEVKDGVLSTTELSQGQRKRLALLTAYLEDRPVYVFDEWAADQDPVFKEVFYYELVPELKKRGKTVVVISHDDRYYGVGDKIVKLEYGQKVYESEVAKEGVKQIPAVV